MKLKNTKQFSYIFNNVEEWFGDMDFPIISDMQPLMSQKLPRSMNDAEILSELKPQEVSLSEMCKTLETMDKNIWAIFYIKDSLGVLRTVSVLWFGDGWRAHAREVTGPGAWLAVSRVFSRNPFGTNTPDPVTPSPLDTLQQAIDEVKKAGYLIYKQL